MNRLTQRKIKTTESVELNCKNCPRSDICVDDHFTECTAELARQLADYEDTNLYPSEIKALVALSKSAAKLLHSVLYVNYKDKDQAKTVIGEINRLLGDTP